MSAATAVGALGFLARASLRNRVRRQVRRLRSPRYLLALLAGGVYMWWFLVRPAHGGGASALLADAWTARLSSLGFALLAAKWWVAGADPRALAFTPSEIHLLFPAPITRRALVLTKLARAQLLILVNTLVWSVILRGEGLHLASWRRALGVWVLFSTLHLHRLAAALSTASVARHGAAGRRRQALPIAIVTAAAIALLWSVARAGPELGRAWTFGLTATLRTLGTQLDAPAARVVLAPFHTLLAPALAAGLTPWLRAIGPALLLLVLHGVWVLRTDVAFEDAAVEASEHVAAIRARARDGKAVTDAPTDAGTGLLRRRTLPLAARGAPALAILWKNAIGALRAGVLLRQLALLGGLAVVVFLLALRDERVAEVATIVAGVWAGLLVIAGPLWVRFDLRQDLPNLALLRAWPLSGRAIVAVELASSTLALTVFQYVLLAGLLGVSFLGRGIPLGTGDRFAIALAAVFALPGVNAAGLTVQNAAALLFPGWIRPGVATRGVEAMGQGVLTMGASLSVLAVLLALPFGAAFGVVLLFRHTGNAWVFVPAGLLGTLLVLAELTPIVLWLGRVFERTEPPSV